ncbi:uncharacterized protein LOC125494093 [Beta vulgaris subsp. vulgaris]|uniref:uncharacterized protein LOC125494093 n=1 Tax=Beta vulgaris subsp. vulgaris TaxID=3555 RepID=UPI00254780FF|nr:uncharacterized protein LOC125494093 [Beta vulgaris subsp. vulgaris]
MASGIQNEKKIVSISEIGKGMKLCTIEVRIIRVWERPNFKNQLEAESIETVLMDLEGSKIQASCRKGLIIQFMPKIKEGELRQFSNFLVRENGAMEKSTTHNCVLSLKYGSCIEECRVLDIPKFGFTFAKFEDIISKRLPDMYYIDIIGQLTGYSGITETIKSRMRTIELVDTCFSSSGEQKSGQLTQLSNDTNDFLKEESIKDISDLLEMNKAGICVSLANIEDIDIQYSWYYDACKRCNSGLVREGDVTDVGRTIMFKIKFIVSDKIADASFLMFDKEVYKLVGKTAKEILDLQDKDADETTFPEDFKFLLGKRFLFKVKVPDNNAIDDNFSYTVISTTNEQSVIDKWMRLYIKIEHDLYMKKQNEAESVKDGGEEKESINSEGESSASQITPQKRLIKLEKNGENNNDKSPLEMQESTTKKLKAIEE